MNLPDLWIYVMKRLAEFHVNTFYKQLALGTGIGFRFDFTFFVLRLDIGFPLKTNYSTDNRNWIADPWTILR
jgi:hypothetical protein